MTETDAIAQAKAAARKAAFAARRAAQGAGLDAGAQGHLAAALAAQAAAPLAGYMPIRTEVDPLPVMAAHRGPVGVPVILGPGQGLVFHRWAPDTPMIDGPFGARIPATAEVMVPQVLIVPLVGFDARGYRLGYGGGFYDRTLAALRAAGPVLAIGFAYAAQELPEVPIDAFDQRLDLIVTETGVRHFTT
ncbi:5-formyltetrahydrofolate cyclo-ligase [Pararhodobacter sp. SW119]|uniref:5-formyltetrahydrofolate cyclo-ligase n=1 Tax=Pararhodobacter sp. SW119 TaxID=2780075 RepID=UPI001ADF19FB